MDVKYLKSMNFHVKQIYRFFKFFVSRFNHFAVIVFLWFLLFLSSKCLCLSNLYILWTCVYIIRQPATKRCWNEQLSWWQMKKPYDQCPINVYFYVQCDHRVQWQWRGIHQQVQQKWTGQAEPPEAVMRNDYAKQEDFSHHLCLMGSFRFWQIFDWLQSWSVICSNNANKTRNWIWSRSKEISQPESQHDGVWWYV